MVYVHPFAEEMNKSRRMSALAARALASRGAAVLRIDLAGCGDSEQTLAETTWNDWVDDVLLALQWLQARHSAPAWLWGLRAGTLLAAAAAHRCATPPHLLFWQATPSGKQVLQQFLRQHAFAGMGQGQKRASGPDPRAELLAGKTVQVAGYAISPALALGLDAATLELPRQTPSLRWLDLQSRPDAELSPASLRQLTAYREAGIAVDASLVPGPNFWQNAEIEDAPALIEATAGLLA